METAQINSLAEWKESLSTIIGQHIYKQNEALKKLEQLSRKLMHSVIDRRISYCTFLESRNIDLYEHLIFTTVLSLQTGIQLGIKRDKLNTISFGSLIHDIGLRYINVPYEDCNMDAMTAKELYELKNHTILGYVSLEKEEWIPKIVKTMVLSHHETMDGTGYPLKQKNEEPECKILQICDSVDRILSGIEGNQGSILDAKREIFCNMNRKYDSIIAEAVLEQMKIF